MIEQSNPNNVDKKKSTWLSNSTYVPVKVIEYSDEDDKDDVNFNAVLDSDSEDGKVVYKRRKEKKKRHNKVKKRHILKHYLSKIPSIDDEKCQFKRMIFAEELPRDERQSAFFLDQRGNPYISQYGSVCEKHIPKYRTEKKATLSSLVSDRYYNLLRSKTKKASTEPTVKPIERKECESHCICHQSFIPVPYDIIASIDQQTQNNDQDTVNEVGAINELLNKEPNNISAWLSLVSVQSKANQIGATSTVTMSIIVEKRLMIVERAITKNQSSLRLHLLRLQLGSELWPVDKLQKEWNQLMFIWSTNIDVWRFYIDQMSNRTLGFSVDKIIAIYNKCFSTFFNVMSGRMKTKTIDSETVMDLVDLFSEYCDFLVQSGYEERAMASWQLQIEYNIRCPAYGAPLASGGLTDDPGLRSLQKYWDARPPLLGQPNSLGWAHSSPKIQPPECPLQTRLQEEAEAAEAAMLEGDAPLTACWLILEEARLSCGWLPASSDSEEDPDRFPPLASLQSCLITIHAPRNLPPDTDTTSVATRARRRLLLLFLDRIGVSHPRVSIRHRLGTVVIRRQQLIDQDTLRPLLAPLHPPRRLLEHFIDCCFEQLRPIVEGEGEDDWIEDFAVLELAYRCRIDGDCPRDQWKEAVTKVREGGKRVLARAGRRPRVWLEYVDVLVRLGESGVCLKSEKARRAVRAEAGRVLSGLGGNAGDLRVRLSLADGQKETVAVLAVAAGLLLGLGSQSPPLEGFCDSLAAMSIEAGPLWHQALAVLACITLAIKDIESFNRWMATECLSTVTKVGEALDWSLPFLYALSDFLETTTWFLGRTARDRDLNEGSLLRALLTPFLRSLSQTQANRGMPLVDTVFSPSLLHRCLGQRNVSCQMLAVRNFLWAVVGGGETETATAFNRLCHGSSLLLVHLETARLRSLETAMVGGGRADRLRSTLTRLLALHCLHWQHRLVLWAAWMHFEAAEGCQDRLKAAFYRAVTEMPAQKCLYLCAVSLVPDLLPEATALMKDNGIRIRAPLEEVQLLLRIRESSRPPPPQSIDTDCTVPVSCD